MRCEASEMSNGRLLKQRQRPSKKFIRNRFDLKNVFIQISFKLATSESCFEEHQRRMTCLLRVPTYVPNAAVIVADHFYEF